MFDNHIFDLVEVTVTDYLSIKDIKGPSCAVGVKPCFLFLGSLFESNPSYKQFQNVIVDFYRGMIVDSVNLSGLESVIVVTADDDGKIYFRVYRVGLKKSGTKLPRVELTPLGPSIDMKLGRIRAASDELTKVALKVPKELKPTKTKNVDTTVLGETVGRVHMQKQDFDSLQSRKVKALKKRKHEQVEEESGNEEDEE
jgi:ribosome production factor 2